MDNKIHAELLKKVRDYEIPQAGIKLLKQYPPLIIAGVSSVGKNTVAENVIKQSDFKRVITHTTRQPRDREINGTNYWFVDVLEIERLMSTKALMEVQLVHGETIYATAIAAYKAVINAGKHPLLLVDIYGALKLIHYVPESRPFFLLPPSFEEWMARFQRRGQMSHTEQARRLQTAKSEMEAALKTSSVTLIINKDIPAAVKKVIQGWAAPETQAHARTIAQQLLENIQAY